MSWSLRVVDTVKTHRGRHRQVGVVLGGTLLGVSHLCSWFVDGDLMTFGPRGYVHCHDVPCSALDPEMAIDLRILGVLTLVAGFVAAIGVIAARRPAAIHVAVRLWRASLFAAAIFVVEASLVHGSRPWRSASEAGAVGTMGLPLFAAATVLVLWGFSVRFAGTR
jgi:hypothetical protein